MVQIVWLESAKFDLKSVYEYIALDSKRYAILQTQRIYSKTLILKRNAKVGKVVLEMEDDAIRELVAGNYRIIYRLVDKNLIHILMIHHGARSLKKRLKRN